MKDAFIIYQEDVVHYPDERQFRLLKEENVLYDWTKATFCFLTPKRAIGKPIALYIDRTD